MNTATITLQTNTDARQYVTTAIESNGTDVASRDEYDLDKIMAELHELAGGWNVAEVDHDAFWTVIERNATE